jgi:hypothetical protein
MSFDKSNNAKYYPMDKAPLTGEQIFIKRGGKFAYEFAVAWNGNEWETKEGRFPIVEPSCWRHLNPSETSDEA